VPAAEAPIPQKPGLGGQAGGDVLWRPGPEVAGRTPLGRLMAARGLPDYAALHRWSVADPAGFWDVAWTDLGIVGDRGQRTIAGEGFLGMRFFPDARLNAVDTLLAGDSDAPALIGVDEAGNRRELTRAQVRDDVAAVAAALTSAGIATGDRVAAWTPNSIEAALLALGALAIGALVSTASPDFGPAAVIDRLGQVGPRLLMVPGHYRYAGREFVGTDRLPEVLAGLPSVEMVVVVGDQPVAGEVTWDEWLAPHRGRDLETTPLPFDHPGFVLFSSGTTGRPKCIVHSAAGVLLKVLSEQAYHLDIRAGDRVAYYTTCGWMMWNWLLCGLGRQACVVLYDGSPSHPSLDRLFALAEDEQLTFLGVSAKLIDAVRKSGLRPREEHDLSALRTLASTGSPLSRDGFDFVYDAVSPTVHLASISGGTDICGCFVAGIPTEPVRRGEIQGPVLGLDVVALLDDGTEAPTGVTGELACRTPFPSVPLGFWGDDGTRFQESYFDRFPGLWAHGDFVVVTSTGGFEILGRSDATLNASGVRIGTAEIYRVVEALSDVQESLAVGQAWDGDTRIVLFVVLQDGTALDDPLQARIRADLREHASPRHVPSVIVAAPQLPRTISGKLAELAVADVVNGRPVRDTTALANAEALRWFADWAAS
jgi:acetoacetyl-CoA synthetase